MHQSEPYLRRRTLLSGVAAGLGLLGLSGCDSGSGTAKPSGPDPLEPILAASVYLADRYTTAITSLPDLAEKLTPLREGHRSHITAITRELGTVDSGVLPSGKPPAAVPTTSGSPSGTASAGTPVAASPVPLPTERAAALADLKGLERTGHLQAVEACLSGPSYRAALLGSIAAARASHVEVLS